MQKARLWSEKQLRHFLKTSRRDHVKVIFYVKLPFYINSEHSVEKRENFAKTILLRAATILAQNSVKLDNFYTNLKLSIDLTKKIRVQENFGFSKV